MIKSGNCYLRYYLLEAANSVRRCDSEFRRYYDLKYHEVNKYQHIWIWWTLRTATPWSRWVQMRMEQTRV